MIDIVLKKKKKLECFDIDFFEKMVHENSNKGQYLPNNP
jgi:hypothetical protein